MRHSAAGWQRTRIVCSLGTPATPYLRERRCFGAIAQLVERFVRIEEVRSSNLLSSTIRGLCLDAGAQSVMARPGRCVGVGAFRRLHGRRPGLSVRCVFVMWCGVWRGPDVERIAGPLSVSRDGLGTHDKRGRSDCRSCAEAASGEHDAIGAKCRVFPEINFVHAHDSVMEDMRLENTSSVDGDAVAERNEVKFWQPARLAPYSPSDLRSHAAKPEVNNGRADTHADQFASQ